jgi:hypothetical protein
MTVPSQYKGFSKLPEHVQQKMDPELAKKYNMGGGVLQRPLFRQMGGPAEAMQPAPMPAPPPPPPPIPPQGDPMVQQTEAQFANIGEQLAQDTMRNIDQAQDIEGAINGLRGNQKPIEARYDELAGFVGQSDAQQTPESVLAMVQPTIMMTEQGAMDSGIGELIQSIAGSDMETPTGEPTPMGQGVGELMAMGAGNTPPVNFNQGGPVEVRRYALGDPQGVVSRATQLQSEFLPLFQQILGTEADRQAELDEIKRMQRSQAAFDVARAGLALASPTDRPMSFVEKLAAAATPLTTSLQQRGDIIQKAELAQKAQDRQAETSALTAALGQAQTEQDRLFQLELASKKSTAQKPVSLGPGSKLFSADGKLLAENKDREPKIITLKPGEIAYNELGEEIASRPAETKTVTLRPGEKLIDKNSGKTIASVPGTHTLSEGQAIYDAEGNLIIEGPKKPEKTHLLGKDQILVNKDGETIAEGKKTTQTVTLSPGQRVVNKDTGETIASADAEAKFQNFFRLNDDGSVDVQSVNISTEEGKNKAQALISDRYTTSETLAVESVRQDNKIELAEKVQIFKSEMFDKKVIAEIEAEQRELGRQLEEEERDQMYFEKRLALEVETKINEEERALGRTLAEEERANIEVDRRKLLDEEIQIRKEIRALENRDNIVVREVNGQIVVFDKSDLNKPAAVMFGEPDLPEPEIRVFTLQQGGKTVTIFEDINSNAGKALLQQVNEQNIANPGSAGYNKPTTIKNTPKGYFIPDEGVRMSYDGGKTYVDLNGTQQNIPGGAFTVSDTIAYDVMKKEKLVAHSKKTLEEMDQSLAQGIDFFDQEGNMSEVINAYESARRGTGTWSKFMAAIDAVVGGVSAGKISLFQDTQEARKFVKMIRVLGRSALAVSPRFAVADLQTVEQLFPDERTFITNPVTEAKKLVTLRQAINQEKVRILKMFAGGAPMDSTQASTLNQKLFEIDRLNTMLGPIDTMYESEITQDAIKEAEDIMEQSVNKGKL